MRVKDWLVPTSFGLALSGHLGHLLNVGNGSVGAIEVAVDEAFVLSGGGERGERIDVGRTALRILFDKQNLVATKFATSQNGAYECSAWGAISFAVGYACLC